MKTEPHSSRAASHIEISKSAILHNVRTIQRIIGERVGIAAVVKACAYGHGANEVVQVLINEQIRFFAVHSIEEADRLDQSFPGLPILILGYVPLSHLEHAVSRSWRLTVSSIETVNSLHEAVGRAGKEAYMHLKLETGTNRQGIRESQIPAFLDAIAREPRIVLEGASMHFANIEDTTDHSFAKMQLERYKKMLAQIEAQVGRIPIRHTASSAASLLFESTHFDMIRFGISLYGLWPSKQTYLSYLIARKENSLLKPVLSWKTIISEIKDVPSGDYIGYGCTYRTTYDSRIAVIPIGYFDGYDRKLSNLAHVLIRGKRAPVRGRICMDIFMVDITHIPEASLQDEVVLIGSQGDERITVEQLADWAGTINYEIVSRINPLLQRVIVD
jgi:alanine racemase